MQSDSQTSISGEITDIFAHRFVIRTETGNILADLGPKGADLVTLKSGDRVKLTGRKTPCELKVTEISLNDDRTVTLLHGGTNLDDERKHSMADDRAAIRAITTLGEVVLGEIVKRPRHFEILARNEAGHYFEHHVEPNGKIRKSRPVKADDATWAEAIAASE